MGLTGILRPNGIFIECNYNNHCTIAVNIPIEEEMDCIYFSSNKQDISNSLLFFNNGITNNQFNWFLENINRLDFKQYELWSEFIANYFKC